MDDIYLEGRARRIREDPERVARGDIVSRNDYQRARLKIARACADELIGGVRGISVGQVDAFALKLLDIADTETATAREALNAEATVLARSLASEAPQEQPDKR